MGAEHRADDAEVDEEEGGVGEVDGENPFSFKAFAQKSKVTASSDSSGFALPEPGEMDGSGPVLLAAAVELPDVSSAMPRSDGEEGGTAAVETLRQLVEAKDKEIQRLRKKAKEEEKQLEEMVALVEENLRVAVLRAEKAEREVVDLRGQVAQLESERMNRRGGVDDDPLMATIANNSAYAVRALQTSTEEAEKCIRGLISSAAAVKEATRLMGSIARSTAPLGE